MTWTSGLVDVTDGQLAFHRTGGPGPVLVLSHGLTDNGLCWKRFVAAVEDRFDAIMLDARGHGRSSRIADGQSFDPARDIADALVGLGISGAIVMGHSVGARATMDLAAARPDLVSRVILEDPPLMPLLDGPAQLKRRAGFRRQVEAYGQMTGTELLALGRKSHPTWGEDEFPAWAEAKSQVDPNALPNYLIPWRDSLAKIQAPTLIVHGEAGMGSLVSSDLALEARGLNALVVTAEIAGAGHNTRRENFEGYLDAVLPFLDAA